MISLLFHPLVWVGASVACYAFAKALPFASRPPLGAGPIRMRFGRIGHDGPVRDVLRLLYLAGPFVVAPALRVAEPWELGLLPPRTTGGVAMAAVFTVCAVALAVGTRKAFAQASGEPLPPFRMDPSLRTAGRIALESAALEAHWAFFRAGVLAVGLQNGALAVFMALGLLALEALSDPRRRSALLDPAEAVDTTRPAFLALLSAMVFLATGSTPVCLVAHLAAVGAMWRLGLGDEEIATVESAPRIDPSTVEPTIV